MLFRELLCLKDPRLWSRLKSMLSSELRSDLSFSLSVRCSAVSGCCGRVEMPGTLGSVLWVDLLRSSLGLDGPEIGPWAAFVVCSLRDVGCLSPWLCRSSFGYLGLWLLRLALVLRLALGVLCNYTQERTSSSWFPGTGMLF